MSDKDLLMQVDGIGEKRAEALLDEFGDGYNVASRALSGWGAIRDVDGFSEDTARDMFHKMREANVFEELRSR